jgi:hypothetical protein
MCCPDNLLKDDFFNHCLVVGKFHLDQVNPLSHVIQHHFDISWPGSVIAKIYRLPDNGNHFYRSDGLFADNCELVIGHRVWLNVYNHSGLRIVYSKVSFERYVDSVRLNSVWIGNLAKNLFSTKTYSGGININDLYNGAC